MIHSAKLNDPFDPLTKQVKEVAGRRQKSDQDLRLLSDLEWVAGFYPSEPGEVEVKDNEMTFTGFGVPNWPGDVLEAMLCTAAAVHKLRPKFKAGVLVEGFSPLAFGEKKNIEQLFGDPKYRDYRRVVVNGKGVMRTRPIFQKWSLVVEVQYLEELLNEGQISMVMETAGQRIGLSNFRPKYGRFTVEKLKSR